MAYFIFWNKFQRFKLKLFIEMERLINENKSYKIYIRREDESKT